MPRLIVFIFVLMSIVAAFASNEKAVSDKTSSNELIPAEDTSSVKNKNDNKSDISLDNDDKPSLSSDTKMFIKPEKKSAQSEVTLVSSDSSGVVFDVAFGEPRISNVAKDGLAFTNYDFADCKLYGEEGTPPVYRKGVWIAVPDGATVNISASATRSSVEHNVKLYPAPKYELTTRDEISYYKEVYDYNAASYAKGVAYGEDTALIVDSGRFRGFRIINIGVGAYEYLASSGQLRLNNEVRVTVSFSGGTTIGDSREEVSEDFKQVLSDTLLNYNVAKTWPEQTNKTSHPAEIWAGQFDHAYKIWIWSNGLYQLTYADLKKFGFDFSVDTNRLRLYGATGKSLPVSLDETPEGLQDIPLNVVDGGDGKLDENDYIEFYGHGSWFFSDNGTDLVYNKNNYSKYNVYWLVVDQPGDYGFTLSDGSPTETGYQPADAYLFRQHIEKDEMYEGENREIDTDEERWFWFQVSSSGSNYGRQEKGFNLLGIDYDNITYPGKLSARLRSSSGSKTTHTTAIYLNYERDENLVIFEEDWPKRTQLDVVAEFTDFSLVNDHSNKIIVREGSGDDESTDSVLFSEFEIELPYTYTVYGNSKTFSNPPGKTGIIEFVLPGFSTPNVDIFDITRGRKITNAEVTEIAGSYSIRFQDSIPSDRVWYIATGNDTGSKKTVSDMLRDAPSKIRTPIQEDIIFACFQEFYDNIQPLADMHRNQGYTVGVYKMNDIYDEFSNGLMDEYAIRNLLKYRYDNPATRPSYLVLVGDTNYDYRDVYATYDNEHRDFGGILVPTIYLNTSEAATPCDNAFVCLDGDDYIPELMVGRMSSFFESKIDAMVDKSIAYNTTLPMGTWRNRVHFASDNMGIHGQPDDGGGHFVRDVEIILDNVFPYGYVAQKNYIEWGNRVVGGVNSFNELLREERQKITREYISPFLFDNYDAFIVQFTGHGNPYVWAHERLLLENHFLFGETYFDLTDRIWNGAYTPIVLQMSCSNAAFDSRPIPRDDPNFDMIHMDCVTEHQVYSANKGAVAATGSAREGYEGAQDDFNTGFYASLFVDKYVPATKKTIGQAFLGGKFNADDSLIYRSYTLIGDPALKVPTPKGGITADLSATTVQRGTILTVSGVVPDNFDGNILVELFDQPYYCTVGDSYMTDPVLYRERLLSKTLGTVSAGIFSVDIPIPVTAGWGYSTSDDNVYDISDALVKLYAYNETTREDYMLNEIVNFSIIGDASSDDETGPVVEILVGGAGFKSGDHVPNNTELIVRLTDDSGILVSNMHENPNVDFLALSYSIDDDAFVDISKYFEPTLDNYQSGEIKYDIVIPDGTHTISVQAYDNFKNVSTKTVTVKVGGEFVLENVYNCPNPFGSSGTFFTFDSSQDLDSCAIKIYTVTGKLINKIEKFNCRAGYNEIQWDGRDRDGDEIANGVYYYKIIARSGNATTSIKEKLIKLR